MKEEKDEIFSHLFMYTLVSGALVAVYTQAKARMPANVDKTWHFLFIIKSESILMNLIALSNLINYMAKEIQKRALWKR